MWTLKIGLFIFCSVWLASCASPGYQQTELPVGKQITGSGFSRYLDDTSATHRWLATQQQAKLEAYRDLAEQIYREPLDDRHTVGSQVVADERYRQYVDVYLRQAQASDYRTMKDVLKAQLTLNLSPRFYQCMRGDVAQLGLCLQEQNKLLLTRLGNKTATSGTVNLACAQRDCSDQLSVAGFSATRSPVDAALLNAGLYDSEWLVNTGGDVMGRYFLLQGIMNGL